MLTDLVLARPGFPGKRPGEICGGEGVLVVVGKNGVSVTTILPCTNLSGLFLYMLLLHPHLLSGSPPRPPSPTAHLTFIHFSQVLSWKPRPAKTKSVMLSYAKNIVHILGTQMLRASRMLFDGFNFVGFYHL